MFFMLTCHLKCFVCVTDWTCKICQGHENILKDKSFLKDQTEMGCNPYRAFRGLVSLPESNHQAAHCLPQPGLGVFSSNVFSAVQLSKLTEQKMSPQVQKQINSIQLFPYWRASVNYFQNPWYSSCVSMWKRAHRKWRQLRHRPHRDTRWLWKPKPWEGLHSLPCWSCPWAETKGDRWPLHSSTLLGIGSTPPFRESL